VPGTLAVLARAEAGLGQEESCRAHAAEVLDLHPHMEMFTAIAYSAIGLLELGAGRNEQAALAFDEVEARAGDLGEPGWLWWQGDAADAYAGCGRTRDARRLLDRLADQADATGRGWACAVISRGRGTLAQDAGADDHLTAAIERFHLIPSPFEEARTLLVRGRRRLGAGDRQAGARDIAAARTVFDRLGARSWSERASALSDARPTADSALTTRLSPAELRVALLVGRGASNQQAADELFISAKTVDYHLQNVYRKLRLRNRAQLMAIVLTQAAAG
jgi:DNA-binding CsgD family transcriptional regulator